MKVSVIYLLILCQNIMNLIVKIYITKNVTYLQDFSYYKNINEIIYILDKMDCLNYDIIETPLDFDHYEQLYNERENII